MENEIRKAKRFNFTALGIVILCAAVCIIGMLYQTTKPISDSVTAAELQRQIQETNPYILVKIGNEYYETAASDALGETFAFAEWEPVSEIPDSEVLVSVRLAELYFIDIYESGYAAAYNEYASRKTVPYAYYDIPDDAAASVAAYLRQSGIPHELGDGAIGRGTFVH